MLDPATAADILGLGAVMSAIIVMSSSEK